MKNHSSGLKGEEPQESLPVNGYQANGEKDGPRVSSKAKRGIGRPRVLFSPVEDGVITNVV